MSTKLTLLEILNKNNDKFLSGQELADGLGISRNAVWKAIKKLQEQGYIIESMPGTGYRLVEKTDVITKDYLTENIKIPCRIHVFDKVASTNNSAKEIEECVLPHIIVANEQTGGRGRLGRSFYSPPGTGLYMSIAFKPNFGLDRAMLITTVCAVVICRAMAKVTGLRPKIKWVNDIYLNNKKVCGILTEAESNFETGTIEKVIIGIGINCFEGSFPEELSDIATYIENPARTFTRAELAAAIVNEFFKVLENFDKKQIVREYKSLSFILGEQIMVYNTIVGESAEQTGRKAKGIRARAIDIDENGGLVIEYMEGRHMREMATITTGEVSIRKI